MRPVNMLKKFWFLSLSSKILNIDVPYIPICSIWRWLFLYSGKLFVYLASIILISFMTPVIIET
jgi:hypothetical protein